MTTPSSRSRRRQLRGQRIDAWFKRRWPNKYVRWGVQTVMAIGIGGTWGYLAGQLINLLPGQ
jgi:hypothetical protein